MTRLFNGLYSGKRVLLTGHTGFKGSWLAHWLTTLDAQVTGYSRAPETTPNHFDLLNCPLQSNINDLTDLNTLSAVFGKCKPEIVFHLAAQPLVRRSYRDPVQTFHSNVIGTAHVLEAARKTPGVKAVVIITTDKVYANNEWEWGYRENDRLGGYDPYSSSKACAEIVVDSYRNSFFNKQEYGKSHQVLVASARAGNVIGGGDWSEDRLIPDIMKNCAANSTVVIRSPDAIRPWQHVLDCLSGYLLLGQKLLEGDIQAATAFNFGPADSDTMTVLMIVNKIKELWPSFEFSITPDLPKVHEANYLKLDCSKAHSQLKWSPVWNADTAITKTINWYRDFYQNKGILTNNDLTHYISDALQKGAVWTK